MYIRTLVCIPLHMLISYAYAYQAIYEHAIMLSLR